MTNQPLDEPGQNQAEKKRQQKPKGRGHGEGSVFERKTGDRSKPFVAQIPLGRGKKKIVSYYATKQEEQVMLRLGFWTRYGINIWAGGKDFSSGRLMSYLILHLMERYVGFLDLCIHHEESKRPSPYAEDDDHTPGKNYTISYWIAGSGWHSREIIDADRLR